MTSIGSWFPGETSVRIPAVCLLALLCVASWGAAAERPNVIFLLTDDQNNDTLGCFGGTVLTPHIDRLASEGVRLRRAYAVSSVCTPSRYTCLTGQYAGRCAARGSWGSAPRALPRTSVSMCRSHPTRRTWPRRCRAPATPPDSSASGTPELRAC